MRRYGEIWRDMGRCREIWGDMGRYGEIWRAAASPSRCLLARAPPRPRPIYSYPGSPSRWHGAHVPRVEASCAPLPGEPAPPPHAHPAPWPPPHAHPTRTSCAPHVHLMCLAATTHAPLPSYLACRSLPSHPARRSCSCYPAIPPAGAAHGGGVGRDGALAADPDRQDGASRGARHPPACPCPSATAP